LVAGWLIGAENVYI